ncbi:cobalamin biosynthesis protein CbiB [Methanobrevibacter cuticularis]|uniref:Probable cobalamin biosynthesis protein CobD n=1 Tax=Methanobrevibacter cuticularis TaxID=47311 RepID=A0A166CL26_9EURY|nr:cobalamin biosynthesis protein [Methanobrevibacter cuticularis]KZX14622.1 cobalamin biosynthesis protein CbiB [Methanobrevibacter cuticularis]
MIENFEIILFPIILFISIVVDIIFGELPVKIHPVVLIGKTIDYFSQYFINIKSRLSGAYLTILIILIAILMNLLVLILATINIYLFILISSIILSSTFSIKFFLSTAADIKKDLEKGIQIARKSMAYLVSRNTEELSEKLIVSATIESLSENITDSSVAPIFYYLLFGTITFLVIVLTENNLNFYTKTITILIVAITAAMVYRAINTLDAMVGYKNNKFFFIGYVPAKIDDIFNYIPSRFSGLMVVLSSRILKMNFKNSYFILKRDSKNCSSPNSGFTMAPTAGALDIKLEKIGSYIIGDENKELDKMDIDKAIKLTKLTIIISIIVLSILFLIIISIFY